LRGEDKKKEAISIEMAAKKRKEAISIEMAAKKERRPSQ
jgi:hypothetical protein